MICFTGASNQEKARQSQPQPAVEPWSGSSLSGVRSQTVDKPEPLWRPVCDEDKKRALVTPNKTSDHKSTVPLLENSKDPAAPPSPRTLKAIQAALEDNSDDENYRDKMDGSVSPRTLLAIHQAMVEEDVYVDKCKSSNTNSYGQQSVPQVIISSSDDEGESSQVVVSNFNSYLQCEKEKNINAMNVKDSLLMSSSEDEMEEVVGQRRKALWSSVLLDEQPEKSEEQRAEMLSEKVSRNYTRDIFEKNSSESLGITLAKASSGEVAVVSEDTKSHCDEGFSQLVVPELMMMESTKQDDVSVFITPEENEESESEGGFYS